MKQDVIDERVNGIIAEEKKLVMRRSSYRKANGSSR
jgi:hypothetical protein